MLLSFKVKNYLSFKDEAGFSMESNKKIRTLKNNKNIIKLKDGETIWLNKTAIFYGANASGKTNILKGLDFLKYITLNSFKFDIGEGIKSENLKPFLLGGVNDEKNIEFEIKFILDGIIYKYFLELNNIEIISEKLVKFKKGKEEKIIDYHNLGDSGEVKINDELFGYTVEEIDIKIDRIYPRENQTFISTLANRDGKGEFLARRIVDFFRKIKYVSSRDLDNEKTLELLKDKKYKEIILYFMNNSDINIDDVKEVSLDKRVIFFEHPIYIKGKKVGSVGFNLLNQESRGTKKLFSLLGPILDTIKNNGILLIDEIDTHMHFLLIENLIKFLHGINDEGKNNIGNSQFIFNTHNLDLMDLELFKKDQIYFTSKDYYGATEIYALDSFKNMQIRNNSDIKKAYKFGLFGAIPILSDFNLGK